MTALEVAFAGAVVTGALAGAVGVITFGAGAGKLPVAIIQLSVSEKMMNLLLN